MRNRWVDDDVPVETLPSMNENLCRPRGRRGVSSKGRSFPQANAKEGHRRAVAVPPPDAINFGNHGICRQPVDSPDPSSAAWEGQTRQTAGLAVERPPPI